MLNQTPKNNNKIILKNQTESFRIKYDIQYLHQTLISINNTQLNVMKQIEYINYKDQIKEKRKRKKREMGEREKSYWASGACHRPTQIERNEPFPE